MVPVTSNILLLLLMLTPLTTCIEDAAAAAAAAAVSNPPNRTVLAWMGWDGRTNSQLDTIIEYFINNRDAITTAAPTSHSLGDNGTLVERSLSTTATYTRSMIFKRLRAGGVRVLPTIWNDAGGMHTVLLPKLLQLAASPDAFIAKAVALAVAEDLDGWNVDFELGAEDWEAGDCRDVWPDPRWGARCEKIQQAGSLLAKFLDSFAAALHAKGKVLSIDIGTDTNPLCQGPLTGWLPVLAKGCYSQWWMPDALNATAVDRFITMTTYQSFKDFVIGVASMLSGFGYRAAVPAHASKTTGIGFLTGEKYSTADLEQRFGVIDALAVQEIDIWFVDAVHGGVPESWLPFLRRYVAGLPCVPLTTTAAVAATVRTGSSSNGSSSSSSSRNRTVMAWMGWDSRTDAKLDTTISWFAARKDLLTASPTSHTLGDNATLQERPLAAGATYTAASVWKELRNRGVRVLPTIWNDADGMHTVLLPKFLQLVASPDAFIAKAVALAVTNDLDGWNVDFEIGAADMTNATLVAEAGVMLVRFVNQFAEALHQHGKVLSLDVSTCDYIWWNATALNASALDRIADMGTYRNYREFIVSLGIASLEYDPRKIGVGFSSHGNFTDEELQQRFGVVEGLNVSEIDVWFVDSRPDDQIPQNWLPQIQKFIGS